MSQRTLFGALASLLLAASALGLATCGKGDAIVHVRRLVHPTIRSIERELESPREPLTLSFPADLGMVTLYLDAGHGAKDNPGNTSSYCQEEQEFTRLLSFDVRDYLEETGHFRVYLSRDAEELKPYAQRVSEAERDHAAALVSLHSDVRGKGVTWQEGRPCLANTELPGYVVLWSDEGMPTLVKQRRALALDVSTRMAEVGFLRYTGDYQGLYENDPDDGAVLVDRHENQKRIFVLRRPTVPSIIVETHHALDPREAAMWELEETRRAFAAALGEALADFVSRH